MAKPNDLEYKGIQNNVKDEDLPGRVVGELRVSAPRDEEEKVRWHCGFTQEFIELTAGESLEWKRELVERLTYVFRTTLEKSLGIEPN